ncbi:hypothetical protein E2562_037347 [Oryza meyeriana var. granulata]|uniref:PGG domain-containing protein n=1 Tax=Oryza meyeriana var. granulata TaxID=110450 RepID=A0A6G1CAD6_9ORYZ|nr:hypothetical protein E2562_037347 [Oryza meyeriana var. granulata]
MVDGDAEQRAPAPATSPAAEEAEFLWELRKYVLLLATLAATETTRQGWTRRAGSGPTTCARSSPATRPVLQVTYPRRYKAFFYCNATSFVASLVIVNLLLVRLWCRRRPVWPGRCLRRRELPAGVQICHVPEWLKKLLELEEHVEEEKEEWKLEKRRKLLLLVAILAASITYEAGMNPPGGFWQEGKSGHVGDPVLNDNYRHRFLAFFFCNATAFIASLAIIMLLVNRNLSAGGIRSYALRVCVILGLVGLMGAFAAGSCSLQEESLRCLVESLLANLAPLEEDAGELLPHTAGDCEPRDLWDEKLPKYLLLLAALAAAVRPVTYQAAMSPPGGLWDNGHIGGNPVLLSSYPRRYRVFIYCNATSFMASLVIMVLLLIKRVSNLGSWARTPPGAAGE